MPVGRRRTRDKHLPSRVYMKHGAFYYVATDREAAEWGKRWIRLGSTIAEMHKALSTISAPNAHTLSAAWGRYQQTRAFRENAEATQADKRLLWEKLLGEPFGRAHPDGVRPEHVAQFLDRSPPIRANRAVALLSHIYTHLIRWGEATRNPCQGVKRNRERRRDTIVSDATLAAWLSHARPVCRIVAELIYVTGRRKSDVLAIRLEEISDDAISSASPKTGKPYTIPMTPDLSAILDDAGALRRRPDGTLRFTEWLICNRMGGRYTASGFDSLWYKDQKTFAGETFAPNDLRAKHASDLEDQGGDATKNLQHSTRQVTVKHYLRRPVRVTTLRRIK